MVLGHPTLASGGERRTFPHGLGGCSASSAWCLPLQHAAVEASSAHRIKENMLMSEERHPFCFRCHRSGLGPGTFQVLHPGGMAWI